MKVAEVNIEKKTKEKYFLLYFENNQNIINSIKNISGRFYFFKTKNWKIPYNLENIIILKKLNFKIIDNKEKNQIKIKSVHIHSNVIIIFATDISRYLIGKEFTFFSYNECFSFGKFDVSKTKIHQMYKMSSFSISIPIGFRNDLFNFFSQKKYINKWKNVIFDYRKKIKYIKTDIEIKNTLNYLSLYDYQIEAVKICFQKTNGIIKLHPGTGKTEIILSLCKLMKIKTLILTNNIDLTVQTYKRGKKAELDIGIMQGKNTDDNHQIVVSTIQSSHKLQISEYTMIIIDECHEIDNQYTQILSSENFLYRFGFSATPFGKDTYKNAIIKQYVGEIIYNIDSKILQKDKKIAIPNIVISKINKPNLDNIKIWRHIEKLGIINNIYRNKKIIEIIKEYKKQTLIMVKKIEHGHILQQMLISEKIQSKFIHGKIKKKNREEILNEFDQNNNKFILIGCKVLKQGISINHIYNLIMAGGGSSFFETIQMMGRGLRVKEKSKVNIFDFQDSFNYITQRQSNQRISDYQKEGFDQITYI